MCSLFTTGKEFSYDYRTFFFGFTLKHNRLYQNYYWAILQGKKIDAKRLMRYKNSCVTNVVTIYQLISIAGYQAAFSQLVFAGKKDHDPCAGVGDAKVNLAKSLQQLSQAHPGKVVYATLLCICDLEDFIFLNLSSIFIYRYFVFEQLQPLISAGLQAEAANFPSAISNSSRSCLGVITLLPLSTLTRWSYKLLGLCTKSSRGQSTKSTIIAAVTTI